jgi:DNA-binding XRE family transcriptional regulator
MDEYPRGALGQTAGCVCVPFTISKSMTMGQQIREWRKAVGIGRHVAAQRLGVSKRTLEHWEQGDYEPSGAQKARVLSVLRGRHESQPDLQDAAADMRRAIARIQRAMSVGDLGTGKRDRLPRIAASLEKFAGEIESMIEHVPPAGSVL